MADEFIAPSIDQHPLDQVIWGALTSRHRDIAIGNALARRYPAEVGPFGATIDASRQSFRSMVPLLASQEHVALFTVDEVRPPPELLVVKRDLVDQMVLAAPIPSADPIPLLKLSVDDVKEMQALVDLTQPGPFGPRTIELGQYLGIRRNGMLIAMTGERMKLPGFTEISAVCVHPSYRGLGLAAELIAAVARLIFLRSEVPFLHVFASNRPAIQLYQRLGFVVRRRMHLAVLRNRS
jgi:ribosomal protein S18 acetylase RimI-like enzyme